LVFARQQLHAGHVGIGITSPAAKLDIEGSGGVILNAGNVGIGTTAPGGTLEVRGHIVSSSASSPTIASCGTGATVSGTDNSFKLTTSSSVTTCTINFGTAWATAPNSCVMSGANYNGAYFLSAYYIYISFTTTQLTITAASAIGTNSAFYIQCL
jgi:hypothetical protein